MELPRGITSARRSKFIRSASMEKANKLSNLLVDSTTVEFLKTERGFLETRMEILNAANKRLYEAREENYEAKKEAKMKFEILEREHSETLRKISERITESGRSQNSKRSSRDSQSQKSNGSLVASSSKLTRKTAIAANVARLKTELEFTDTEGRKTTALREHEDEPKRFKGVIKNRNMEHSGMPEHSGTSRNIPEHEKIKIIFMKKNIIK